MKTFAIAAALATLFVTSAHAANPIRKRTETRHKSLDKARVPSDESYDPYLGMEQRKLELEGRESMSMVHSMSMPTAKLATDAPTASPHSDGSPTTLGVSGAMAIGTTVSALVSAGAVLLL
eukprot:CAMPEP_0201924004 /NCGR_PEP_ID=MMETSP0903-20130614/12526_1 /ASSEMBLY_ACC=CAM_ASM_000552 /TAXON_ID=420261 /ORGANISM="Thalassiosira antarctica, Strain CCMP982" /LENGTH=120 /DNA_ID=CAMNT_0048461437 /DNA_START=54 /DNA_END=416 /DNA_ORIENTATION=-